MYIGLTLSGNDKIRNYLVANLILLIIIIFSKS